MMDRKSTSPEAARRRAISAMSPAAEDRPRHLVTRDPGAHHPVAPDLPADLAQHLEAEAHAILEAPAVLVGPSLKSGDQNWSTR
jgi:hypothetical protein